MGAAGPIPVLAPGYGPQLGAQGAQMGCFTFFTLPCLASTAATAAAR